MKNLLLLLITTLFSGFLSAQTVTFEYTYDAAGNRIKREVILIEEESPEMEQKSAEAENEVIEEEELAMTIEVFPNPATSYLNVQVSEIEDARYELFSTNGQFVSTGQINQPQTQIQLHTLQPGMYLLRVQNKGKVQEFKIIKR